MEKLKLIESQILDELNRNGSAKEIMDRGVLIERLLESRAVAKNLGKSIVQINKAVKHLMDSSKTYKFVSVRAAKFFFLAAELVKINPMYQFTHEWFLEFLKTIIKR